MNPSLPPSPSPGPAPAPPVVAGPARLEQLLDLLADEVADRLQAREPETFRVSETLKVYAAPDAEPETFRVSETLKVYAPPSHAAALLARLALGLLALVVAINIPFNRHGTTLATALPGSASLVIRNGLVVKEADRPEIYVFRNDQFHWISSLDAFEYYDYRWQQVHVVEPGFLAKFELGAPIHVLLKCSASPHIYRLENDHKRWIVDLSTFSAEGHVWEDVKFVSCDYLRSLPDGDSIPSGRDSPPPPLP